MTACSPYYLGKEVPPCSRHAPRDAVPHVEREGYPLSCRGNSFRPVWCESWMPVRVPGFLNDQEPPALTRAWWPTAPRGLARSECLPAPGGTIP